MVTVAKQGGIENEKKLANFLMVNNTFFINSQLHDKWSYNYSSQDKKLATKVVEMSDRFKNRRNGYTRLFRIPNREKDQAKMGIVEYIDNPYPPLPHPSVREPPAKIPVPPS